MRITILNSPQSITKMFTKPPKLRIRTPSSTTVEFTLSNAPPPTLPHTLLTHFTSLLRLILAATTLLLLLTKFQPPPYSSSIHPLIHPILATFSPFSTSLQWRHLLPASAVLLYVLLFIGGYTEESLVVIRDLGVQITTKTGWSTRSRFIPTERVSDMWICEGFRGFEVRFYLAVVVEGEEGLVVVFPVGLIVLWEYCGDRRKVLTEYRHYYRDGGC